MEVTNIIKQNIYLKTKRQREKERESDNITSVFISVWVNIVG